MDMAIKLAKRKLRSWTLKIADIWKTSETLSMEVQLLRAAIKFNLKPKKCELISCSAHIINHM